MERNDQSTDESLTVPQGVKEEVKDDSGKVDIAEKPIENGTSEVGANEKPETTKDADKLNEEKSVEDENLGKIPLEEKTEKKGHEEPSDKGVEIVEIVPKNQKVIIEDDDIRDYDDMYKKKVGQFGIAQAIVVFCICIPTAIPGPLAFFAQMFLAANPDHWCSTPQLDNLNLTLNQVKTLTLPWKDSNNPGTFSQCKMYDTDFVQYLSDTNGTLTPNTSWPVRSCKNGYTYDQSVFKSSIITDWDLVCDKDLFPTIANAVANLGMVIGGILFAYISDKYGRKKGLVSAVAVLVISGIAACFAPEIYSWMILRMFFVSSMSIFFTVYVYAIEFVGRRYRAVVSVILACTYSAGLMTLSLLAYFIRDWKTLSLAISIPNVLLFIALWFLPESPRWLLIEGRLDELKVVLTKLARLNKKEEFNYDLTKLRVEETKSASDTSFSMLFKTPNLRKKMIILTYLNLITAIAYFGLSLFSSSLGTDPFLSVLLIGAAELPGNVIGFLLMDRLGRRWTTALTYVIAGAFVVISLEIHTTYKTVKLVIFLLAKVSITANYMPIIPFTSELLPTALRNMGLSVTTNIGVAGTAVIPFILYLGQSYMKLPMEVIGGLTIAAGFFTLLLPETLHQSLPETVVDAEMFGKNMGFKDYTRCIPLKRKKVVDDVDSTDL